MGGPLRAPAVNPPKRSSVKDSQSPPLVYSPSLIMSNPVWRCRSTSCRTAASPVKPSGAGKLPTCVVRILCVLRSIARLYRWGNAQGRTGHSPLLATKFHRFHQRKPLTTRSGASWRSPTEALAPMASQLKLLRVEPLCPVWFATCGGYKCHRKEDMNRVLNRRT